jgi:riboflavin kinase/FMN adenylyltransferase
VHTVFSLEHPVTDQPVVLTVGKFDGVHLGHQRLIGTALERARSQGLACAVLTFDPHPEVVLHPDKEVRLLTTLEERRRLIGTLGADFLVIAPFNRETMSTPAYDYMRQICNIMPLRELWVGEGFALGRKREGTVPRLTEIGHDLGYTVGTVDPVMLGGERVNSSRVRRMLLEGAVTDVEPLLGRPFSFCGEVVEGDRRGRTIGFPTANLRADARQVLPADGVYACAVHAAGEILPAVTNIGVRPTFDGLRHMVEAHLLDWFGDLYGQTLRLEFFHYLRGERKFSGIEDLTAQIRRDAEQARKLLADKRRTT